MNVSFSLEAEQDLDDIFSFIAVDSKDRAIDYTGKLEKHCDMIGQNPNIGRNRDDLKPGLKSFPVVSHLIFYRVKMDDVEIVRILHGSRDISEDYF